MDKYTSKQVTNVLGHLRADGQASTEGMPVVMKMLQAYRCLLKHEEKREPIDYTATFDRMMFDALKSACRELLAARPPHIGYRNAKERHAYREIERILKIVPATHTTGITGKKADAVVVDEVFGLKVVEDSTLPPGAFRIVGNGEMKTSTALLDAIRVGMLKAAVLPTTEEICKHFHVEPPKP